MMVHVSFPARAGHGLLVGLFLGMTGLAVGCGSGSTAGEPPPSDGGRVVDDGADDGAIDGDTPGSTGCPAAQAAPSFAKDVKPFLDAHCTVCHSTRPRDGGFAPIAQNFETYAGFKPWAREALASLHQKTMPPPESDAPATASDICMIESWIDQGANDN
jgi:hypothetical protein